MSWTPRKLSGMSDGDIIDTVVDGYIDGISVEELFDKTDMSLEDHLRILKVATGLVANKELFELAVVARRLERGCDECEDKDHQSCPNNAHLN